MPGGSEYKPPSLQEEVTWTAAAAAAARFYKVPLREVLACGGKASRAAPRVLPARQAALYMAATVGNMSGRALRRATGLDRMTVRYHLATVENNREWKAGLDDLMIELTARVAGGLAAASETVAA